MKQTEEKIKQGDRNAHEYFQAIIDGHRWSYPPPMLDTGGYFQDELKALNERLTCDDGFSISIQASTTHYSSPRTNYGPYDAVELGFPHNYTWGDRAFMDIPSAEWMHYWPKMVWGYTPVEFVWGLIDRHTHIRGRSVRAFVILTVLLVLLTLVIGVGGT